MSKVIRYIIILTVSILINSCGTYQLNRTKEFTKLNSSTDLNAEYVAYSIPTKKQENPTSVFPLFNIQSLSDINYFKVNLLDSKSIKIEYFDYKENANKELVFEGKLKKKFFEIYFEKKQLIIPLIVSNIDINRLRIGKDKNDNLVLMNFYENSGNLLIIGAGYSRETPYLFKKSNQFDDFKPFNKNNKWGYKDSNDNIVIETKYDYASFFYNNLAIVQKNGKYGLIDKEGNQLVDFEYDNLELKFASEQTYYLVTLNDKKGVLNLEGKLVIPINYDAIRSNTKDIFNLKIGNKHGFASLGNFIIPAIYSREFYLSRGDRFIKVERDGKRFFLDNEGYEYESDNVEPIKLGFLTMNELEAPILSTKRKPELIEQNIK